MKSIRELVEFNVFGVCTYLGEKFNIATSKIRLYFIYLSFLTFGSPVVLYFVAAFWMNLKRYIFFKKRNPLWYN
jgi:phage shock protein PspC (stress-responsive transcriptional regulator)